MNHQGVRTREVDQQIFRAPANLLDPPTAEPPGEAAVDGLAQPPLPHHCPLDAEAGNVRLERALENLDLG